MKIINKYVDEISGREFSNITEAKKSEKRNDSIKKMFSFWKYRPKEKTCSFANGEWCYQHSKLEYFMLMDTLIKAVNKYEPWIAEQYKEHGGLQRKHMKSGFMIGRYLDDGDSELDEQYGILSSICPICFREWGQSYYAINCKHNIRPKNKY